MIGHGAKFIRKKEAAIAALLTSRNVEEAARLVGIGPATLQRWMKEPEFREALQKASHSVVRQATSRLQQNAGAASATMLRLMADPNVPAAVRLRAAECVYDRAMKGVETDDIE